MPQEKMSTRELMGFLKKENQKLRLKGTTAVYTNVFKWLITLKLTNIKLCFSAKNITEYVECFDLLCRNEALISKRITLHASS